MVRYLLIFLCVVALSSCKKCVECSYEYIGARYSSGTVCGTREEIEDVIKTWELYTYEYGMDVTCERDKEIGQSKQDFLRRNYIQPPDTIFISK